MSTPSRIENLQIDWRYDAGPTGCGELIMNVFNMVNEMEEGQVIEVVSYDRGAREDIPAWCRMRGHGLNWRDEGDVRRYYIRKGAR